MEVNFKALHHYSRQMREVAGTKNSPDECAEYPAHEDTFFDRVRGGEAHRTDAFARHQGRSQQG